MILKAVVEVTLMTRTLADVLESWARLAAEMESA